MNSTMPIPIEWIPTRQARQLTGLSRKTLSRYARLGQLRKHKVNQRVTRWNLDDLRRLVSGEPAADAARPA